MSSMHKLTLTLASLLAATVQAAPDSAVLLQRDIAAYDDWANHDFNLPKPDLSDCRRLIDGKVVSYRERWKNEDGGGYRVTAYVVVDQPRLRVWVTTLGTAQRHASRLTEVPISFDNAGGAVWYQYLSLPWPLADRHWLLQSRKITELAAMSDGRIWEHRWELAAADQRSASNLLGSASIQPVTEQQYERAIYMPMNRGGWVMTSLGSDRTLVAVYANVEFGGRLPGGLVARLVGKQLKDTLGGLGKRSASADAVLSESTMLYSGQGVPIDSAGLSAAGVAR